MALAVFLYDGQCPRCKGVAHFLTSWSRGNLKAMPFDADGALDLHRDLSFAKLLQAPHLVLANGYLCAGAEACAHALAQRPGFKFVGILYYLPLFKQLSQLAYRLLRLRARGCEGCGA